MLAAEPLRFTGALWADGLELRDPMVSPVNGTMTGLPPTSVYAGTHDILTPDARRFRDLASSDGVTVELHEAKGQIHAYPLWPTSEARDARHRILADVRGADRTA